jgi:hypothetical protein
MLASASKQAAGSGTRLAVGHMAGRQTQKSNSGPHPLCPVRAVHQTDAAEQGPQLSDEDLSPEGFQDVRVGSGGEHPFHTEGAVLLAHHQQWSQSALADGPAISFCLLAAAIAGQYNGMRRVVIKLLQRFLQAVDDCGQHILAFQDLGDSLPCLVLWVYD